MQVLLVQGDDSDWVHGHAIQPLDPTHHRDRTFLSNLRHVNGASRVFGHRGRHALPAVVVLLSPEPLHAQDHGLSVGKCDLLRVWREIPSASINESFDHEAFQGLEGTLQRVRWRMLPSLDVSDHVHLRGLAAFDECLEIFAPVPSWAHVWQGIQRVVCIRFTGIDEVEIGAWLVTCDHGIRDVKHGKWHGVLRQRVGSAANGVDRDAAFDVCRTPAQLARLRCRQKPLEQIPVHSRSQPGRVQCTLSLLLRFCGVALAAQHL